MSYIYRHDYEMLRMVKSLVARGAKEVFGVVVKHGVNQKTATVRVNFWLWIGKYKKWIVRTSYIHAHDPYNMCKIGDRVCIKACTNVSPIKSHYLSNFYQMIPRINLKVKDFLQYEKQALLDNEDIRIKSTIDLKSFFDFEEPETSWEGFVAKPPVYKFFRNEVKKFDPTVGNDTLRIKRGRKKEESKLSNKDNKEENNEDQSQGNDVKGRNQENSSQSKTINLEKTNRNSGDQVMRNNRI